MTSNAPTKNATLIPINVALIPSVPIGQNVAKIIPATKRRVIVINILTAREDYFVVLTIVPEEEHIWTAVQVFNH